MEVIEDTTKFSDNNIIPAPTGRGRKKVVNRDNWKKTKDKILRYSAKCYPKQLTCEHKTKNFNCPNITMQDIRRFHQNFYSSQEKITQDKFILKYTTAVIPKRSRSRKNKFVNSIYIQYYIPHLKAGAEAVQQVQICQKAFADILGITRNRIQRICKKHMKTGEVPRENRGGDRHKINYNEKRESVKGFIENLKPLESHYSRKNLKTQYLSSELSIKKLWRIYNDKHSLTVRYGFFRNIFVHNYNISFKMPSTDECSRCAELTRNIKNGEGVADKIKYITEFRIHKLRANAFFKMLKKEEENEITFSYDCQKNMVMPKLSDQSAYYRRQFYTYNFTICQCTSKASQNKLNTFIYTWTDAERFKGLNEIVSAVYHRLLNTNFAKYTRIRLVSNGCAGQNKNMIMIGMLSKWLYDHASANIKEILIVIPVTGHSYIPPDKVFGRIEKIIQSREIILTPGEYFDILSKHGMIFRPGIDYHIFDWKSAVSDVLKPTSMWHFEFSLSKRITIKKTNTGNILIKGDVFYKSDICKFKSVCKVGKKIENIRPLILLTGVPINSAKIKDVSKLLRKHYGPDWSNLNELKYYKNLLYRSNSISSSEDNDFDDDLPMNDEDVRI